MVFSTTKATAVQETKVTQATLDTSRLVIALARIEKQLTDMEGALSLAVSVLGMLLNPTRKFYCPGNGLWYAVTITLEADAEGAESPAVSIDPTGDDDSTGWVKALRDPITGLYHSVTVTLEVDAEGGTTPDLRIAPVGTVEPM